MPAMLKIKSPAPPCSAFPIPTCLASKRLARPAANSRPTVDRPARRHRQLAPVRAAEPEAASAASPDPTPRSDDCLPNSLTDALEAASQATCAAMDRGVERCIVEILLPEFWDPLSGPVYAEEGDQQRFWKLTRRFLEYLVVQRPGVQIRAIYPDAGVAAMLKNQWTDAPFAFASVNDRRPVQAEDEIIVMAAPDPPGLNDLVAITRDLLPGQTMIMFNPRLASGDVGVGLNIRRLREGFLSAFTTTYSLRPVGEVGSVFRSFPELWKVFVADATVPGRYTLIAEKPYRPAGEELDLMLMTALGSSGGEEGKDGEGPGVLGQIGLTISSLQRFMRSLSQ